MQNLSDSELDDLFKKAVAQSEGETRPSASEWERMVGRLPNSEKGAGILTHKTAWVGVSVIVLSSLVLVYFLTMDNSQAVGQESGLSDRVQPVTPESKASSRSSEGELTLHKTTESQGFQLSDQQVSHSSKRLNTVVPDNDANRPADEKSTQVLAAAVSRIPESDPSGPNKMLLYNQQFTGTDSVPIAEQIMDVNENTEEVQNIEGAEADDSGASLRGSHFALKISGSPDFSSIGIGSPGKPGWNYGAFIEYHLNERWSIAAGALRARKFYESSNVEYNGYMANWLDGDCGMWDIPVNVYYHFTSARKWSFFSSVGLSSYLMSRERYVYTVDSYYGQYQYEQEVNGENNEWFKMLNLSVGVEKRLDRNFSIQVEPFLKAPLAGVGEGDVSLASFGAFFSLKYNFLSKQ
jgi:hypothetical protein